MKRQFIIALGTPMVLLGVVLLGFWAEQWWVGLAQEDCGFGPVGNARYQKMRAEARRLRWMRSDVLRSEDATLARDIDTIAPPTVGVYERLAATHAVMRVNGLVLARRRHPSIAKRTWEIPLTCDPTCGFEEVYLTSRIYGFRSLFLQASRKHYFVEAVIYNKPHPPDDQPERWAYLQSISGRTRVTSLTPSFKGPGQNEIVDPAYACPAVPPPEWASVFDAFVQSHIDQQQATKKETKA